MSSCRPEFFRKRQFEPTIIVTCVRWYLRFSLSLRDVKELMAERGHSVDHTTVLLIAGVRPRAPAFARTALAMTWSSVSGQLGPEPRIRLPIQRTRLRTKDKREQRLGSYELFQRNGPLEQGYGTK